MKKRIWTWLFCLAVAVAYIAISRYIKNLPKPEVGVSKGNLQMYNDIVNSDIIMEKFASTHLSSEYELSLEEDEDDADIIFTKDLSLIKSDKESSTDAYTPIIVGLKNNHMLQKYEESGLLSSSKGIKNSADDEITINFLQIIEAVVNDEKLSNFGGVDKEVRVFVPEKDSVEGKIFYNFLLVTINNGTYPRNDDALKAAVEKANAFLAADNVNETSNIINELTLISSINYTDIYILYEADFINSSIWSKAKLDICIAYPEVTLVKHIYTQLNSEEMKDNSKLTEFYNELSSSLNYRTSNNYSFEGEKSYNIKDNISFVEVSDNLIGESKSQDGGSSAFITFIIILIVAVVLMIIFIV